MFPRLLVPVAEWKRAGAKGQARSGNCTMCNGKLLKVSRRWVMTAAHTFGKLSKGKWAEGDKNGSRSEGSWQSAKWEVITTWMCMVVLYSSYTLKSLCWICLICKMGIMITKMGENIRNGLPVSAPTWKQLGNWHSYPCNKKELNKLKINNFTWTHQRTEFAGQTGTPQSRDRWIQRLKPRSVYLE